MNGKMSPQRVILTLDPVSLWSVTNCMWRGGKGCVVSTVSRAVKMRRWKFLRRKKRPLSWFGRGKVKQPPKSWSVVEQKHPRQQSRCCGNRREGLFYHQQISSRQWDKNSTRGHAPVLS